MGATERRPRELPRPGLAVPDSDLVSLLQTLKGPSGDLQQQDLLSTLHKLCNITSWQEQNQKQAVELGAVGLALQLLKAHAPRELAASTQARMPKGATSDGNETEITERSTVVVMACLSLLGNLSANEDLAAEVAGTPACAATLVSLLAVKGAPEQVIIHAARCLINLTHFNSTILAEALQVCLRGCHCSSVRI